MKLLDRFSLFVTTQKGIRKNLLAFFLGVLVTLALPPIYILPLAILGFSGFLSMILASTSLKESFYIGWLFGFGHFTSGLYWIAFALLVDVANFGWLIPFAIFGIPAVIAIYIGIVSVLTWHAAKHLKGWSLVIVFACGWTIIEMLRGWLFTGFPWNLTGYIWTVSDNMLQLASITGIWGLSLITVITFTMPALLGVRNNSKPVLPITASFLMLIIIFIWGGYRLSHAEQQFVPNIKLRIVQANIPQSLKWEEESRYETVQKYLEMSKSEGFENITHVIWPETALPFVIGEDSQLLDVIATVAPANGAVITGTLRADYTDSGVLRSIWNSLAVIDNKGTLYSHYDKSHLVPFGEYVPFRSILPLEKITHGSMDFSEGTGANTINAPNFPPFGGLICYEVIFPGKVVNKENKPEILINVTNDAWYGNTSGPYQHFQMTRVRAIEEGTPLIRSANNGISGVIDAYGRILGKTRLGSTEILDISLPSKPPISTTYGRYHLIIPILIIGILLLIACINSIIYND